MFDIQRINKALSTCEYPKVFNALFTWPKFSISSFLVVSRIIRQGIIPYTILDIGANIGQFSIAAGKLLPCAKIFPASHILL
jgi:hypothetical protein